MRIGSAWTRVRALTGASLLLVGTSVATRAAAQDPAGVVQLDVERMVELALSTSYQVRYLDMNIDQTRLNLRAERARLRSSVSLDLSAPDFQSISESQWNSELGRNEIVRENSRRWEAALSVRQPVILFGYPTNGYLSLNNRVYRYSQIAEDGSRDVQYYNRYFVRYRQPLFQPNGLRNSLEEAELDLEDAEIEFYDDVLEIVQDVTDDYFELFEDAYDAVIGEAYVANLEQAMEAAEERAAADSARAIDLDQVRVELANARESVQQSRSNFRLQTARVKTRLQIPQQDSVVLDPVIEIRPVTVDVEAATEYARRLAPRLRRLDISRRENEIRVDRVRGRNSFRVDVEFTYGREMQEPYFSDLWQEPTNTYTVDVNAYVPIWDWGERDARVDATRISLRRTELQIEQAEDEIASNVENEVRNVEELQDRVIAMEENLGLASQISQQSLSRYREGSITALDLLQSLRREVDTARNLLDAYLGWRSSLLRLEELTYFDFERGVPALQSYGITGLVGGETGSGPLR